jgi:hypothetical protein
VSLKLVIKFCFEEGYSEIGKVIQVSLQSTAKFIYFVWTEIISHDIKIKLE